MQTSIPVLSVYVRPLPLFSPWSLGRNAHNLAVTVSEWSGFQLLPTLCSSLGRHFADKWVLSLALSFMSAPLGISQRRPSLLIFRTARVRDPLFRKVWTLSLD